MLIISVLYLRFEKISKPEVTFYPSLEQLEQISYLNKPDTSARKSLECVKNQPQKLLIEIVFRLFQI
jgi:hypothetical protein